MADDIQINGAPRKATQAPVGYPYALPLNEAPTEKWARLFNEGWTATAGMKHEPIVDGVNKEILVSVNLADKAVAAAALNKVVALVNETTERCKHEEARAAEEERAGREVAEAKAASDEAFLNDWWTQQS